MATGDQQNIVSRLASIIPPSWFSAASTVGHWWSQNSGTDIGALLQAPGNVLSYVYSLCVLAKAQMRLLTSVGMFIDLWSYDRLGMALIRKPGETDAVWKLRVCKEVVRIRVSRSGMSQAIQDLTGVAPVIIEPWSTGDCGAWSHGVGSSALPTPSCWAQPAGVALGTAGPFIVGYSALGYDIFQGQYGWGTTAWTACVLMIVTNTGVQGIPSIGGWSTGNGNAATMTIGAWTAGIGSGATPNGSTLGGMSWVSQTQIIGTITTQDIYNTILRTKPVGVQVFVKIIE